MRKWALAGIAAFSLVLPASAHSANQTLTVTKAGTGSGTVTSSPAGINCGATCSASFAKNTNVTLTATPDAGSSFSSWSGACTGSGSCTMRMSSSKSVTANFTACYPTSYTNGPLGGSNLLPACGKGFLIDYPGGSGVTWAQEQSGIMQRESDIGRNFAGIGIHDGGGGTYGGVANCAYGTDLNGKEQWIHDNGSFPVVSWSPNQTLAAVNSGSVDACFAAVADYFQSFNFPIILRIFWEFDAPGHSYTPQNGGSDFIQAWQHMVGIFQSRAAVNHRVQNVGFFWCPTHGVNRTLADASYPGDAYVDWVGADGYNHDSGIYDSPLHPGWAQLWEILGYPPTNGNTSVHDVWGPHKPYIVGETGSMYDSGTPTAKADWFRNISSTAPSKMQYLRGVEFFDQDLCPTIEMWDWRVDSNQTYQMALGPDGIQNLTDCQSGSVDTNNTYQGFKDMAASNYFN